MKDRENVLKDILKFVVLIPVLFGGIIVMSIVSMAGYIYYWVKQPSIQRGICPECGSKLLEVGYEKEGFQDVKCPNGCLDEK